MTRSGSPLVKTTLLGVLLFVVALAPTTSFGQERDTGRHKPVAEEPAVVDEDPETSPASREPLVKKWHLGVNFGVQGASELFRVETVDGGALQWESINGDFNASRFTATFDQNFSLGLFLQKDMGEMWALRADLGVARMDLLAEALSGQYGVVYLYDRMDVLNVGIGAEFRLTRAPSYPFAGLSFLLSRLSPSYFDELAQTNLGGRLSLGYLQRLTPEVGLRIEGRYAVTTLDVEDFRPPARLTTDPEVDYDPQSSLHIFELLLAIQASFGG